MPVDDPIKISRLKTHESFRTNAAAFRYRLRRVGARRVPRSAPRRSSSPRSMRQPGRCLRGIPGTRISAGAWRLPTSPAGRLSWTGDRTEFLGRNGTLDQPAALARTAPLSNRVGAGLDPCGALQTRLELKANGTTEIVFLLGEAATPAEAQSLLKKYRAADLDAVLGAVTRLWDDALGTVQVTTPDRAMDILLNRWLLYQTLACRVWARSAFYQASGAYGFRDQLQDVMALCVSRAGCRARASAARRRRGNSSRATCSIGGCRKRGEGSARASPTTASGSRMSSRITSRSLAILAVLDEIVPFLEGPIPARRRSTTPSFSPCCPMSRPRCSSTARAHSIRVSRSAATVCR